jgi:hypothetical protein
VIKRLSLMRQPFLFESQLSKCVISGHQCLYIALHFRGNGDLLPAMPFSRFASFPAWVISGPWIRNIASLFPGTGDPGVSDTICRFAFPQHGCSIGEHTTLELKYRFPFPRHR